MAGTDITSLLEAIQKKINAVDSSASTGDLLRLLSAVRQSGSATVFDFEEGEDFPNLLDNTDDLQMLAFNRNNKKLYFQKDRWFAKATTPATFQGSNYGYATGGNNPDFYSSTDIQKFPFASDGNATDVGDLSISINLGGGQSSTVSGYASGTYPVATTISKFPFASTISSTNAGDLTLARRAQTGQSASALGYGYNSGGWSTTERIDKFPFASDANATAVGDLTLARFLAAGQSSTTHGYTSGGTDSLSAPPGIPRYDTIDKFPFAADANATDVGDLTDTRRSVSGQSSTTDGYTSGGALTSASNIIDKFPFASDGNATDVGDLSISRLGASGQSSTTDGYTSGGDDGSSTSNVIDKFSFASDGNATDVGDLSVNRQWSAGQQY